MLDLSPRANIWAGVGVEVMAVGIGAILTPTTGVLIALGGLLFFYPAFKEWRAKRKSTASCADYMPLHEAAAKLYTECRAANSMWAMAAERMSGEGMNRGSPEDILDYMANVITGKKDIYGKRMPSQIREKISQAELRQCSFVKGAMKLEHIFPGSQAYFTDLEMRSADLDDLIQQMHFESGFGAETK